MKCESCSTTALAFNKAFNKGFKARKATHTITIGGKQKQVCDNCFRMSKVL